MSRRRQADRARRTVYAPNGARVVFPEGTPTSAILDTMLKWVYQPLVEEMLAAIRPALVEAALGCHCGERARRVGVAPPHGLGGYRPVYVEVRRRG
jgi:hypothetical protein